MKWKLKKQQIVLVCIITGAALLYLALLTHVGYSQNIKVYEGRKAEKVTKITDYEYAQYKDLSAPAGIIHEYEFQIPADRIHDTCLAFYLFHQYGKVYLEGECIYSLSPSGKLPMIKTTGYNWVTIPIYAQDAGKEVKVQIIPVYSGSDDIQTEFLMGPKDQIMLKQLTTSWIKLTVSELLIFMGIILGGFSLYYLKKYKTGQELVALSLTSVLMGIWRYTDSRFAPFVAPDRPILLFLVSFSCMMMGMIPIMVSQTNKVNEKVRKNYDWFIGSLCLIAISMQWAGLMELRSFILIFHITAMVGFFIILVSTLRASKGKFGMEEVSVCLLFSGAVLDAYYFYVERTEARTIYLLWGLLIYIIISAFSFMVNFAKQKQLMEIKERQLIHSRISSMMGQIRSHFVFNILNAISGMCKYDPEKADQTIVCFSRYLRTNINIMYDDEPVPFLTALGHLDDYIALEQVRFGDKIRFEKHLEIEDFFLPSLVMQPLVENALKHGILPKKEGGTITLHTWEEEGRIRITIQDDGVGFDPKILPEKTESVGIQNVRLRLKYMVDGELEFDSHPGEGTLVSITFPKVIRKGGAEVCE